MKSKYLSCETFDPVWFVLAKAKNPAHEEHLKHCPFCTEDVREVEEFMFKDSLDEDLIPASRIPKPPGFPKPDAAAHDETDILLDPRFSLPLVQGEITEGRGFAHLSLAPYFLEGFRLQITRPKGQYLLPIGVPVRVKYAVDEDAYIFVGHSNGQRKVRLIYPEPNNPSAFWKAGPGDFAGTIAGAHGERQQFMIVASKEPLLPNDIPFDDPEKIQTLYGEALKKLASLPQDQWCKMELRYTAVDLKLIESYSTQDLQFLQKACEHELTNPADRAKSACAEICNRVLSTPSTQWNANEAFGLFYQIIYPYLRQNAAKLIRSSNEKVLEETISIIYSQLHSTASKCSLQSKFISACELQNGKEFKVFSFYAFLYYLRRIIGLHWRPDHRAQEKAEKKAALPLLRRDLSKLSPEDKAELQEWVFQYVLQDGAEREIFSCVLEGKKPRKMLTNPAVQKTLSALPQGRYVNKELANSRDSILWITYKRVKQKAPKEITRLMEHVVAVATYDPSRENTKWRIRKKRPEESWDEEQEPYQDEQPDEAREAYEEAHWDEDHEDNEI